MAAPPIPNLTTTSTSTLSVGPLYSGEDGDININLPLISKKDMPIYLAAGAAVSIFGLLIWSKK